MTTNRDMPSRGNPFSTRFIRPGAIVYRFEAGQSPDDLVGKLSESGWRGQIIGPHGSGKSTLIAALIDPLASSGSRAIQFTLRDGQRSLPRDWARQSRAASARLIVVDGYEQLSFWSRLWLKRACRRQGLGMLVTAHRDVGFPTLLRTGPSLNVAQAIVADLLPAGKGPISREAVAASFAQCQGNLRETLFALYDQYEAIRAERAESPKLPAQVSSHSDGTDCTG